MFTKILCSTDGSPVAHKAARAALDLARQYGATLTLINVAPISILQLMLPHGSLGPEDLVPKEMEKRLAESSHRVIQETLAALGDGADGVAVQEIMGHAGDEICSAAEVGGFDLVVIGSCGQGALKRALLGSVSDYVVRHCTAPVLVIKAD